MIRSDSDENAIDYYIIALNYFLFIEFHLLQVDFPLECIFNTIPYICIVMFNVCAGNMYDTIRTRQYARIILFIRVQDKI